MHRNQKQKLVSVLNEVICGAGIVIIVHYKGLSVEESNYLRNSLYESGGTFRVAKNTLVKLAVKDTAYESSLSGLLTGPTALVYSGNPVEAAKILSDFAKDNEKLVLLGGVMGENVLQPEQINALAKLPSLDILRAQLLGLIQAPARNIACVTSAAVRQLVQVTKAYSEKDN